MAHSNPLEAVPDVQKTSKADFYADKSKDDLILSGSGSVSVFLGSGDSR